MHCLCRSLCLTGLTVAGLIAGSGCGTSPRDEFIYKRQVVLRPEAGDGSRIAARMENRPQTTAALSRAVAQADSSSIGGE